MWKSAAKEGNKFPWHMMCLNLEDTRLLVKFFTDHVAKTNKGIANMLNKIEYFDESNGVLTDLTQPPKNFGEDPAPLKMDQRSRFFLFCRVP